MCVCVQRSLVGSSNYLFLTQLYSLINRYIVFIYAMRFFLIQQQQLLVAASLCYRPRRALSRQYICIDRLTCACVCVCVADSVKLTAALVRVRLFIHIDSASYSIFDHLLML